MRVTIRDASCLCTNICARNFDQVISKLLYLEPRSVVWPPSLFCIQANACSRFTSASRRNDPSKLLYLHVILNLNITAEQKSYFLFFGLTLQIFLPCLVGRLCMDSQPGGVKMKLMRKVVVSQIANMRKKCPRQGLQVSVLSWFFVGWFFFSSLY